MAADIAFVNGPVLLDGRPVFGIGVALANGRITYVGEEPGMRREVSGSTRVIDLGGRLLTPGFQDAHVHPLGGLDMRRCDLNEAGSADAAVKAVADYAQSHPEETWIKGGGWSMDWFDRGCPSRALLDAVISDRPVYLPNRDGHSAWVNSRALTLAGVDAATPDPVDGRIERLADGSPQGTLHEGARYLVIDIMPPDSHEEIMDGLDLGQAYLISKGITGWQDAHVDGPTHRAYLSLAREGRLSGRAAGALWWDRHRGLDQISEIEEMWSESEGRYRPVAVKLMADGVVENHTASMIEPYHDGKGGRLATTGIDFIDPSALAEIVTLLDSKGMSCHIHAIGDGAVRNSLDAFETARGANGPTSCRHSIAHLQVVHPSDIPRFAALAVTANCQTLWACDGGYQTELTKPFLGEERIAMQYPFGSLIRSGARLAMGSDWDVSTADVFYQADVAVTRSDVDEPEMPPLNSQEAISLTDSLIGFTTGSAYLNFLDDETGVIEVGRLADLAVLDRDPFREPRPAGTLVDMTLIGGEVVYER